MPFRQTEVIPREKYVRISNLNRISGTPSNFAVDMSNDIDLHLSKHIWLESVSLPHVFYNITSKNNDLVIDYGGLHIIDVPPGFYSVSQLIAILKSKIDIFIAPDIVTITLDSITSKLSFVFTNPNAQFFSADSNTLSTMSPYLGITANSASNIVSFTGQEIPNLSGPRMIYIHSKELNLSNTMLSSNRNVSSFASIPVNVPFLSTISYQTLGSEINYINLQGIKDITNVNIKLRLGDGTIANLGDNHEMIIVFKVFY